MLFFCAPGNHFDRKCSSGFTLMIQNSPEHLSGSRDCSCFSLFISFKCKNCCGVCPEINDKTSEHERCRDSPSYLVLDFTEPFDFMTRCSQSPCCPLCSNTPAAALPTVRCLYWFRHANLICFCPPEEKMLVRLLERGKEEAHVEQRG